MSSSRFPRRCANGAFALALLALTATPALARKEAAPAQAIGTREPEALKTLQRMHSFLAGLGSFRFSMDASWDVVQRWGEKIEFGEQRVVTLRRPDSVRVDTTDRDGSADVLVFDGSKITVYQSAGNTWGSIPFAGNIDQAVTYVTGDLGMRLPMSRMLASNFGPQAGAWAHTVRSVGTANLGGVPFDHVAMSGEWEDVQVWIAQGAQPVPQRVVITYKRAEGHPQFRAQIRDWLLNPAVPDSTFQFTAPANATMAPVVPMLPRMQPPAPAVGAKP
ncbi:MAG: DUF2092 domain-containing protein [Alphaproteobacteria bacterium]